MPEVREMADAKNLALPALIAIAVPGAAFALMGVMPLMVFTVARSVEDLFCMWRPCGAPPPTPQKSWCPIC